MDRDGDRRREMEREREGERGSERQAVRNEQVQTRISQITAKGFISFLSFSIGT